VAILTKHIVFLVMIGVSAYVTWALLPQMQRLALLQAAGREAPDSGALAAQEERMMRLSLALGVLILGLTAVARAS
jgi:putative copper export protein